MQKWEYAHAMYDPKDGRLDPYIHEGLAEIGCDSIPVFLSEAGRRGWEMCGHLPYPNQAAKRHDGIMAVIFKRPVANQKAIASEPRTYPVSLTEGGATKWMES